LANAAYTAQKRYYEKNRVWYRSYHKDRAERSHRWFFANMNVLKAAQGCRDCGTREGTLLYHHLDPSTKRHGISQMGSCSLETLLDEIAKCTVLCRPCHLLQHGID